MTINELIERLKEFNPDDEIRIGGCSIDYSDVGVSDTPNVVSIYCGIKGIRSIIDELADYVSDLDYAIDYLEDDDVNTDDICSAAEGIRILVDDLEEYSGR